MLYFPPMPMPDFEHFFYVDQDMLGTYAGPLQQHPYVGRTIEEVRAEPVIETAPAVMDFFRAGVLHLAVHGSHDHLQEVGTIAHQVIGKSVHLTVTDNVQQSAQDLGWPSNLTNRMLDTEPNIVFNSERTNSPILAHILLPPNFIVTAQNSPIEALASTAWLGSFARDVANGRMSIDPQYMTIRAQATEAQFLLGVKEKYPDLSLSRAALSTLRLHPQGIESLPQPAKYRGITYRARYS